MIQQPSHKRCRLEFLARVMLVLGACSGSYVVSVRGRRLSFLGKNNKEEEKNTTNYYFFLTTTTTAVVCLLMIVACCHDG